jgi:hypothetical protein
MTKKKEKVQNTMKLQIYVDKDRFEITDDKYNALVRLDSNQVSSIINVISYLIDEDIPAMIKNGKWNKESWNIKIDCELPVKDMIELENE